MTETLEDFLSHAHGIGVQFKNLRVTEDGRDAPIPFVVTANRGSQYVASFFPAGRDQMLDTMRLAVGGFGCDRVAGTVDAYTSTSTRVPGTESDEGPVDPDTGKPIGPGDLERAFQAKKPWVTETLMTSAVDRVEQRILTCTSPYRAEQRRIDFGETNNTGLTDGLIPNVLRQVLRTPDMMVEMRRILGQRLETFEMTPSQRRIHADVACLQFCAERDVPVFYAVADEETKAVIARTIGDVTWNAEMGKGAPGLEVRFLDSDD